MNELIKTNSLLNLTGGGENSYPELRLSIQEFRKGGQ